MGAFPLCSMRMRPPYCVSAHAATLLCPLCDWAAVVTGADAAMYGCVPPAPIAMGAGGAATGKRAQPVHVWQGAAWQPEAEGLQHCRGRRWASGSVQRRTARACRPRGA